MERVLGESCFVLLRSFARVHNSVSLVQHTGVGWYLVVGQRRAACCRQSAFGIRQPPPVRPLV